jgi:hypothetical protein
MKAPGLGKSLLPSDQVCLATAFGLMRCAPSNTNPLATDIYD